MNFTNHGIDDIYIRKRIQELLSQMNVTEYKMSLDLGKSRAYIQNITSGRALPSLSEFLKICDYLGVEPKEFFDTELENPTLINELVDGTRKLNGDQAEAVLNVVKAFSGEGET